MIDSEILVEKYRLHVIHQFAIVKPGTFVHANLVSWNCFVHASVCVCVSIPKAINNQWCDMAWYRLCAIGWTIFTAFPSF